MRGLLVILVWVGVAASQSDPDPERIAKGLERTFETGVLGAVLERLPEQAFQQMAESPAELRVVAATAAKHARKCAKGEPDAWKELHQRLRRACEAVPEAQAASADARAARAETVLCGARVAATLGEPVEEGAWAKAADLFLEAYRSKEGGVDHLVSAVRALREGGRSDGPDSVPLLERADELVLEGADKHPNHVGLADLVHRARLRRILATADGSVSKAKKLAQEYAEEVQGLQSRSGGPNVDSMYNDLVTLGLEHRKLGLRLKYRSEEVHLGGVVGFDVPVSDRWTKEEGKLCEYDEDGNLKRTISTDTYDWDTDYYAGSKMFSDANLKGLAQVGEAAVLEDLAEVRVRSRIRKVRLSKDVTKAQEFTIGGLDKDGNYRCHRYAYFKGEKAKQTTIRVAIIDFVEEEDLDPEAAFVLSTVRE